MQLQLVYDFVNPKDQERIKKLTGDKERIFRLMSDGKAWLIQDIAQRLDIPECSCSANVRNLRKDGFVVKRISLTKGLSAYQLEVK